MKKPIFVSILVVVKNEESHIKECLGSLVNQDFLKDKYEIIVVDGISTDRTREIVLNFKRKYSNIFLYNNYKRFYAPGLNIGIKKSKGNILIKVDGHVYVAKDFISKNVEYLHKTDAVCVGGPICTIGKGFIGESIACVLSSPFGVGGAEFRYDRLFEGYVNTVPFGAYKRKIFDKIGFFNESLIRTGEDLEFHKRIRENGGKLFITPKIKSYYYCSSRIKDLMKEGFINGYEVIRISKDVFLRHLIPFLFVASLLFISILALFATFGKILLLIVLGLYFSLAVFFSVAVCFQKNAFRYFFILPIIFFLFHFSYGIGSIWFIIKMTTKFLIKKIKYIKEI